MLTFIFHYEVSAYKMLIFLSRIKLDINQFKIIFNSLNFDFRTKMDFHLNNINTRKV